MQEMQLDLQPGRTPAQQNLSRLRLAAQILAYLTWPDDSNTRDAFLREPYLAQASAAGAGVQVAAPSTSTENIAQAALEQAAAALDDLIEKLRTGAPRVAERLIEIRTAQSRAQMTLWPDSPYEGPNAKLLRRMNFMQGYEADGRPDALTSQLGKREQREQIRHQVRSWRCAGLQLLLLAQMVKHHSADLSTHRGPSLGKAQRLLERHFGVSRRTVEDARLRHGSVAHVAAAVILLTAQRLPQHGVDRCPPDHAVELTLQSFPLRCLALAASFEMLGQSFSNAHSTRGAALPAARLWNVPQTIELEPIDESLPPLKPQHLRCVLDRE